MNKELYWLIFCTKNWSILFLYSCVIITILLYFIQSLDYQGKKSLCVRYLWYKEQMGLRFQVVGKYEDKDIR